MRQRLVEKAHDPCTRARQPRELRSRAIPGQVRQNDSDDLRQAEAPPSHGRNEGCAYSHQENRRLTTPLPGADDHHCDDASQGGDIEQSLPDVHDRGRGDGDDCLAAD